MIKMYKKGENVKFNNFKRKIKSSFMIYADFKSIQVPRDNRKQKSEESYANKYKKDVTCSYGYKLVYVDDKFSKPFLPYVGEGAVYNFNNSMAEERKYCGAVMKKHFNKNSVIT